MDISKADLIVILKALSALETAYMVTLKQEGKTDGFGYWDCVEKATLIIEEELSK